uniref:Uncharacterized protein n=1 Tax=Spumella elongata TaxID=89044 RepID=A0A7S3GNG6_9STRA|mmetsp:Transcript_1118/g.1893  ORF Transcript_1118/g.1893 Transcript_1118/m.1893 type:complete len:243 (+) Transcript_1118:129-857(+)|eukprot:CAMPEP_0184993676 /NCGR_PEP_ID=MMETSP1098-20130426/46408_1 /TAXON_ID=89044 /ORGANISM="Spumella elongata, Strain CCAP 955/1" /LENGTH=242 /DNA_ID=CAMNT_0027519559 /DNA_START=129 /DNA_END=857 /DNA_ORIENTATION=-
MNENKPNDDSNNEAEGEHHVEAEIDSSVIPNQDEETKQENNVPVQNTGNHTEAPNGSGNVVTNALWGAAEAATTYVQQNPTATIVGGIVLGAAAAVLAAPLVIANAGFSSSGVKGGSFAAGVQSSIGNVAAGSAFATLQSVGATGVLTAGVISAAAATGAVTVGAATAGGVYMVGKKESADNQKEQSGDNETNEKASETYVPMAEAVRVAEAPIPPQEGNEDEKKSEHDAQELTADNYMRFS